MGRDPNYWSPLSCRVDLGPERKGPQRRPEVIGADGVHVGTVDKVEGGRIKLTKKDSGEGAHKGHHHFIKTSLVADVEGSQVRLSANAAVAVTMEQEESAKSV